MATRPIIKIPADTEIDIYAALNDQVASFPELPTVTAGAKLRIQNKSRPDIYLHEGAVYDAIGGTTVFRGWQAETKEGQVVVKVTCLSEGLISAEVI